MLRDTLPLVGGVFWLAESRAKRSARNRAVFSRIARSSAWYSAIACWPDEVAHILDVPPATVKTRMFYARKKLAELVKDSNVKSTEQVTKRVLNCAASRRIRSPCAELAAQYSHSTPTPTAVRPSLPASP